jgi:hypothetical protein
MSVEQNGARTSVILSVSAQRRSRRAATNALSLSKRQHHQLLSVAAAILAMLLLTSAKANAAAVVDCPGTQAINSSIGGSDAHSDQINAKFAVTAGIGTYEKQPIAYEYQTYGGKEYLEFNVGDKIFIPYDSGMSIFATFKTHAADLKISPAALPPPFDSLTSATSFQRTRCK